MADVLAHPFRLVGGRAATVDDSSEAGAGQELAVLVTTRPGERVLVPDYGITDPAFTAGLDLGEVNTALAEFGPEGLVVTDVHQAPPDEQGLAPATISYDFDPE